MRKTILLALVAGSLAVGCYAGTGTYSAGYSTGYYGPELAYVSPGVQVVAGYDQPVFYSDNFYWRYHGNRWYRSSYYDRGWVYAAPPRAVLSIDRPYRYRNYRPSHYSNRGRFRDHRSNQRPVYRGQDRRQFRQAPVRTHVRQPAVRGQVRGNVRQAPVRRDVRNAPVQRQQPARRDDRRGRSIRNHRR